MNNFANQKTELSNRRPFFTDAVVFLLIVAIGVASRFWLWEYPNFKPIAALVLFGGFYFRRAWPAIAALVAIMIVSDLQLGVYNWRLAACVYASLGLACGLGVWVKRSVDSSHYRTLGWNQAGRFAMAAVGMSTAFYILTNGAVWGMRQWYPKSWTGLVDCYLAGIPFFRATLMGDMFFTGVLVGGFAIVETLAIQSAGKRTAEAISS